MGTGPGGYGLVDGDYSDSQIDGPLKYRKRDFGITHMPSDDTIRRVAVRIKFAADRLQLFGLLF